MKNSSKIFISGIFLLLFALAANAQKEWLGSYVFDEDGGRTAGGTAIFIEHRIDISEADDGLIAMVQSNGYQTSKDLICTTKTEGAKLLIYFDSYGENNVLEPFEKGDLLLTLERKTVKGKTEILTFWGKFEPIVPKNEKTGKVYFTKTK
jgi:uncharacterized protein DUF5991